MRKRTIKIDKYRVIIEQNKNVDSNYGLIVSIADDKQVLTGRVFKTGSKDVDILTYAIGKINQFNKI